jgi:hypothetical protein
MVQLNREWVGLKSVSVWQVSDRPCLITTTEAGTDWQGPEVDRARPPQDFPLLIAAYEPR